MEAFNATVNISVSSTGSPLSAALCGVVTSRWASHNFCYTFFSLEFLTISGGCELKHSINSVMKGILRVSCDVADDDVTL